MKSLLVVYHSMTGGARQMANAVLAGACKERGVETRLLKASDAGSQDVLAADAYIFVTPENLAAVAGVMKDFFDRTYYPCLEKIAARGYAVLICAGSDGHNAVRQIDRICTGWRLRRVADPQIICTRAQTPEAILAPKTIGAADLQRCAEIGEMMASGLALGVF